MSITVKKTRGRVYSANTLDVNLTDYSQLSHCIFEGQVVNLNIYGNQNIVDNSQFNCNNVDAFIKFNQSLSKVPVNNLVKDCYFYNRMSIKENCCVCDAPITLNDVIINLKNENYCLCSQCSDLYLTNLLVVMKL
jgi:hypothetical protein